MEGSTVDHVCGYLEKTAIQPALRIVNFPLLAKDAETTVPPLLSRLTIFLPWLAVSIYTVLVLICAAHHEAWLDEAQSWLVARDASIPELLFHQMRYEGSPALWHMILVPFAKLGLPYTDLSFVSAAFGIMGVLLFVFLSPFPLWLRLLFPFTYFPLFQFSVVARNYVLILPLICGLAALFPKRLTSRTPTYFALLALLANVSVHGAMFAGCLIVEWLLSAFKAKTSPRRIGLFLSGAVVLYSLLFLQLLTPADLNYNSSMHPTLAFAISRTSSQISEAFFGGLGASLYFRISFFCAVAVVAFSSWWLRKSTMMFVFLGTLLALILIAAFRYSNYWHSGVIFLVWVFAIWVSAEQSRREFASARWLHLTIGAVFFTQAIFGLRSVWWDIYHPYSASRAAAEYVKATGEDQQEFYAWGFKATALQPYFSRNLFARQEHGRREAYYSWSKAYDHAQTLDVDHERPAKVLLAIGNVGEYSRYGVLRAHGYCEERRFEGQLWWKNGGLEPDTYIIMVPCK